VPIHSARVHAGDATKLRWLAVTRATKGGKKGRRREEGGRTRWAGAGEHVYVTSPPGGAAASGRARRATSPARRAPACTAAGRGGDLLCQLPILSFMSFSMTVSM